jgi:prepilin-type N-terminal cleavage/methylation domain-containing protein
MITKYERVMRTLGFTLIEIVVTIGIMSIVSMGVVPFYLQFAQEAKLTQDASILYSAVQLTKSKARAGEGGDSTNCAQYAGYDLIVNAQSLSTKLCCSAACSDVQSKVISTNTLATGKTTITQPSAGTHIRFAPLTGATSTNTIEIRSSSISKCQAIQIQSSGPVSLGTIYGC